MGEVRSTVEDVKGRSPLKKLEDAKEQLQDLLQVKKADLAREGVIEQDRNLRSIRLLEDAVEAVSRAEASLRRY